MWLSPATFKISPVLTQMVLKVNSNLPKSTVSCDHKFSRFKPSRFPRFHESFLFISTAKFKKKKKENLCLAGCCNSFLSCDVRIILCPCKVKIHTFLFFLKVSKSGKVNKTRLENGAKSTHCLCSQMLRTRVSCVIRCHHTPPICQPSIKYNVLSLRFHPDNVHISKVPILRRSFPICRFCFQM